MLRRRAPPTLAGKHIGLFSYGSGCTSEFFSGVVGKGAAERIQRATLDEVIGARERMTVDEYERLMAMAPESPPDIPPARAGSASPGCISTAVSTRPAESLVLRPAPRLQ